MRYQLADGKIVDDLNTDNTYKKRYRSSNPELHQQLPIETALLHKLLKEDHFRQVVAHLDLHQDYITSISKPYMYFYAFDDCYIHIVDEIKKHIAVLADTMIDA